MSDININMPVNLNHIELAHDIALMGDIDTVAQKHGLLPADINKLMKQPDFANLLQEFQDTMIKEVRFYITSRAKDAVQTVESIMKDESAKPNVRLNAAKDLLDRAGLAAKKTTDVNVKNTYNYIAELSDDELDKMLEDLDVIDID